MRLRQLINYYNLVLYIRVRIGNVEVGSKEGKGENESVSWRRRLDRSKEAVHLHRGPGLEGDAIVAVRVASAGTDGVGRSVGRG